MGSSGTLAQTEASDFDYWVVVRQEEIGPTGRALLGEKVSSIEAYCRERYGQAVTFFILDEGQVRANAFDVMDEESSGSAQKTLLKEEFYRTFIMIAGRIPFWVVLPTGLDDRQYRERIDTALKARHFRFLPEDYIDLGNLTSLDRNESLGAILWQIYKARHSPFKSLLKAALIAYYFFSGEDRFLCDIIKDRFLREHIPGSLLDPYALVFEKALSFFESLEDAAGLELLRSSIFLRLSGQNPFLPAGGSSPREALLQQYLRQWAWDEQHVGRLSQYRKWPETEKLRFEKTIFQKISFLYEMILKGKEREDVAVHMTGRDFAVLTNRIAVCFQQKAGKIERCSSYAGRNTSAIQFVIEGKTDDDGRTVWSVFGNEEKRSLRPDSFFFSGPGLLKTAGWLIRNGLFSGKRSGVTFQAERLCEVTGHQARRLTQRIYEFVGDAAARPAATEQPALWMRVAVCLHDAGRGERKIIRADFLSLNTWGEFFYNSLPLAHAKRDVQSYYHIAEYLWDFIKDAPSIDVPFLLVSLSGGRMPEAEKVVRGYLGQFMDTVRQLRASPPSSEGGGGDGPDIPLILDL
jgi:adenylate cyclase class 1